MTITDYGRVGVDYSGSWGVLRGRVEWTTPVSRVYCADEDISYVPVY